MEPTDSHRLSPAKKVWPNFADMDAMGSAQFRMPQTKDIEIKPIWEAVREVERHMTTTHIYNDPAYLQQFRELNKNAAEFVYNKAMDLFIKETARTGDEPTLVVLGRLEYDLIRQFIALSHRFNGNGEIMIGPMVVVPCILEHFMMVGRV